MKKRKVISFFVLLLLFASVLTIIEIYKYGKIIGFVSLSDDSTSPPNGASIFNNKNTYYFVFSTLAFVFILVFVARYLHRYSEKAYENDFHSESNRKRRMIDVKLD